MNKKDRSPLSEIDREARRLTRYTWTWFAAFAACCAAALAMVLAMSGCSSTHPVNAYTAADGSRVGVSKNVVFFTPYDAAEAFRVALDTAGISAADSVSIERRVRAFGSSYFTTVIDKP